MSCSTERYIAVGTQSSESAQPPVEHAPTAARDVDDIVAKQGGVDVLSAGELLGRGAEIRLGLLTLLAVILTVMTKGVGLLHARILRPVDRRDRRTVPGYRELVRAGFQRRELLVRGLLAGELHDFPRAVGVKLFDHRGGEALLPLLGGAGLMGNPGGLVADHAEVGGLGGLDRRRLGVRCGGRGGRAAACGDKHDERERLDHDQENASAAHA